MMTRSLCGRRLMAVLAAALLMGALRGGDPAWAAVTAPAVGDPAASVAATVEDSRTPVILVHGLRGSGPSTWGAPASGTGWGSGMFRSFCVEGYTPGRTLFVCDYQPDNLGDFREIALRDLPAAIDLARARSGAAKVDIVARSMGGLVARAYLSSPQYRDDVRTLVLIAVPNRGSFGANIVKSVEMTSLQEQLRQRGAASRRSLSQPVLPPQTELIAAFTDEVSYVARQSQVVWEPLFGYYYSSAWLLAERNGGGRVLPPGFFEWLERQYPSLLDALVTRAQQPPVSPSYMSGPSGSFEPATPGPGESLTRAYYELLAIACARHNFFLGIQVSPPEVVAPPPAGSLIERALAWVMRILQGQFGVLVRQRGQTLAMWAMEHLAGLDPKSRAADCLLEESVGLSLGGNLLVDAGPGAAGARVAPAQPGYAAPGGPLVLANYYFHQWNDWDEQRRAAEGDWLTVAGSLPDGVKVVSIAGQIPNVWSGIWPDVGANDVIVETSSTYLPLAANDSYHLLPSLIRTNHVWIGASGQSWRIVASALRDYFPVRLSYKPRYTPGKSRLVSYVRQGEAQAQTYQPYYLELLLPAAGSAAVTLRYTPERSAGLPVGQPPPALEAWVYLDQPGTGLRQYRLDFVPSDAAELVGSIQIAAPWVPGTRLLVGARVRAQSTAGVLPPPDERIGFRWELGYDPRVPAAPEAQGGSSPPGSTTSGGGWTAPPVSPGPVINATHRDNETVHVSASVRQHARWEWDMGDGTRLADTTGAPESVVEHAYRAAGTYIGWARSLDADGVELSAWRWETIVEAADLGVARVFRAATPAVPEVQLQLDGPAAWVTGRPADFRLTYTLTGPPGALVSAELVFLDPGPEFSLVWHKPGVFTVTGALGLRLHFTDGTGARSMLQTYVVERQVQVYAMVVTD